MKIIKEIHRGGFGIVYEARRNDGTLCALKKCEPSFEITTFEEKKKIYQRFAREVKIQSKMDFNFFIEIKESDLRADPPWYTMPYADRDFGIEIEESRKNSTVPVDALADILNALEHLHSRGYVHRDLKPGNVLLHDGKWKLSDFGLVLPPRDETTVLTSYNSNWGSRPYCAPEQSVAFKKATTAVDIYAFGCILHDIVGSGTRIPFQQYDADGPLGRIIKKCTHPDPSKRFQSISALRNPLLTILSRSGVTSVIDPDAEEWLRIFREEDEVSSEQIDDFVEFVSSFEESEQETAFLKEIEETDLEIINNKSEEAFNALGVSYSHWAHGSFVFAYCDVLAAKLERIFLLGSIDTKAEVALALAALGNSHNRWFVMAKLLGLCGKNLDAQIAERIAIEIAVEERHSQFTYCAAGISKNNDSYHDRIAEELNSYKSEG